MPNGGDKMNLMEHRRRIMEYSQAPVTPTIGGLPVYVDNAFYPGSNGIITNYGTNSNYFLTGIVDTGSTDRKYYDTVRIGVDSDLPIGGIRLFNDLNGTSVDYWTIMRPDLTYGSITPYSFRSYGRYIILTVAKDFAADFYLKDENGNYLLKGNNVT